MLSQALYLILIAFTLPILSLQGKYPVVVFHGIYDSCESDKSKNLVSIFSQTLNTYVRCIEVREGESSVTTNLQQ